MFKFNLQPNEELLNIYRQTEWVLVKPVLWVFILIYLPWFFLIKYELDSRFKTFLLIWTLLVLGSAINKFILWLLNSYIVTDKRLVSIKYKNVLHKQVIETPLERILNISYETRGLFASFLNYGNIDVQIVGLTEPIVLKNIRDAEKIKDYLWQVHGSHSDGSIFNATNIKNIEQNIGYQQKNSVERAKKGKTL